MKAFLLAAGLGTRLKPFTDNHPKALATINGKTLLERAIRNLQKFKIYDFVINVHHFGDQIIDFLNENNGFGSRYEISDESQALLETGGGLLFAKEYFKNTDHILMLNVDILSNIDLKSMIHYHLVHSNLATLAIQKRNSSRQLMFEYNDQEELQLKAWYNQQTQVIKPENYSSLQNNWEGYSFSGIQILNIEILNFIQQTGKFSIIDTYLDLMNQHKIVGFDHSGDLLIDAGKPESIQEAEQFF